MPQAFDAGLKQHAPSQKRSDLVINIVQRLNYASSPIFLMIGVGCRLHISAPILQYQGFLKGRIKHGCSTVREMSRLFHDNAGSSGNGQSQLYSSGEDGSAD